MLYLHFHNTIIEALNNFCPKQLCFKSILISKLLFEEKLIKLQAPNIYLRPNVVNLKHQTIIVGFFKVNSNPQTILEGLF